MSCTCHSITRHNMRAFEILALLVVCSVAAQYVESDSDESAASIASPESSESSISSEEVVVSTSVEIEEGSGSGDVPLIPLKQISVLGILPGPGDIRKKRTILDTLSRK